MLTLQFVPYQELKNLDAEDKIKRLLKLVKENKIVLMQGRLSPFEETKLIQETMEEVTNEFKGIEVCTIYPEEKDKQFLNKLKTGFVKILLGNREGLTIIGPANIVKEIKRDPNKIQLLADANNKKRRSKRRK